MNLIMNLIRILSTILCGFWFNMALAQTVPDDVYLQNKLDKETLALTYDELKKAFENNPMYSSSCVVDTQAQPENEAEVRALFTPYLDIEYGKGLVHFNLTELKYGFDLRARKLDPKGKVNIGQADSFEAEVSCGAANGAAIQSTTNALEDLSPKNLDQGNQNSISENSTTNETEASGEKSEINSGNQSSTGPDEEQESATSGSEANEETEITKNCGSLNFSNEIKVLVQNPEEKYPSEGIKQESWDVYYVSQKVLLAKVEVVFETEQRGGLFGNSKSILTYQQNLICELTPASY